MELCYKIENIFLKLLKADKSLSMGDYDFASSVEISVYKCMDRGKKPVVAVSTIHKGENITVV